MQKYTTAYLKKLVQEVNLQRGYGLRYGLNPPYVTVGAVDLSFAYGGVKVIEYVSEGGGERELSSHGYGTKKEAGIFLEGLKL